MLILSTRPQSVILSGMEINAKCCYKKKKEENKGRRTGAVANFEAQSRAFLRRDNASADLQKK